LVAISKAGIGASASCWTRCNSMSKMCSMYKVVQIWPGQTVTCLHTNSPGHIWTTLYIAFVSCFYPRCQVNVCHYTEQDRQYMYDVTLRRVHETTVAMEEQ
jgi:hypothetical protein